jgi:hypothetical protein
MIRLVRPRYNISLDPVTGVLVPDVSVVPPLLFELRIDDHGPGAQPLFALTSK